MQVVANRVWTVPRGVLFSDCGGLQLRIGRRHSSTRYILASTDKEKLWAKRLFVFYVLTDLLDEDPKFIYENHWKCLDSLQFAELNQIIQNEIQCLNHHCEDHDFLLVARAANLLRCSI